MRRQILFAMLLLAMLAGVIAPALADAHDKKFKLTGEARARWEYTENYLDADDDDVAFGDDSGDFFPYRFRIAAEGDFSDMVRGVIEIQNFGFFGNEPFSQFSDPIGQTVNIGTGSSTTELYRGFIEMGEIHDSSWSLRIGRQEHTLGRELHMGDLDFYNGQFFDGLRAMRKSDTWDLDLFLYDVAEGDALGSFVGDDVLFMGATARFTVADNHDLEPYVLFLRDADRDVSGGNLYTVGLLYERDARDGMFDWAVEAATQFGEFAPNGVPPVGFADAADADFGGTIFEGHFGVNLEGGHRIHLGVLQASGDDDADDGDLDFFVPLFPDNHANNRLGDLDLFGGPNIVGAATGGISNITDLSLGYTWTDDDEKRKFMVAVHSLAFAEEDQLGLTDDAIGIEIDAKYDYWYNRNLGFQVGVGFLSGDDALDELYVANGGAGTSADDIMRGWWQARLRW